MPAECLEEVRERQKAKAAAARDVLIDINVRPFNTFFQVLKSQLAVPAYFAVYLASLDHNNRTLNLDGFDPVFFILVAQWLTDGTICPLRDNCVNILGDQLAIAAGDPIITFSTLFA